MSATFTKILLDAANGTLSMAGTTKTTLEMKCGRDYDGEDSDDDDGEYIPYAERSETYIVPILFFIILIVGVTGNGILVLTLLRHSRMRNVPNTYVLSLAIGDLLVIVTCVPFTSILYTFESWPWGVAVCKYSECVKHISIGVSVFTLTALSAERYCAIVNPIRRHVAGLSAKPLTILTVWLIWILAIILSMPDAIYSHIRTTQIPGNITIQTCYSFPEELGEEYKMGMVIFKFLAYYIIPLCIIAGFYVGMARHLELSARNIPGEAPGNNAQHGEQIRARKKVGKMVIAFVVIFFICFLPSQIFTLWYHLNPCAILDYNSYWHALRIVGFCLSFINSCVNPIALYCVSADFRKRFNEYLFCCVPRISRRDARRGSFPLNRRGNASTYETSFNSTNRRPTNEFNTTVLHINH